MTPRLDIKSSMLLAVACSATVAGPPSADAQGSLLAPLGTAEPITYFVAVGEDGSEYRESDRDLALWALEAWQRASNGAFELEPAPEAAALVRIYWVPASAGQYGEMRPLRVDGRRGAAVYIRPDVRALGADIARSAADDPLLRETIVYLTCLHELGHAFGLEHTAEYADVMYFFGFGGDVPGFFGRYRERLEARRDIVNVSGLSDGDLAQLSALYADSASEDPPRHP
jgi:hypothetical protein